MQEHHFVYILQCSDQSYYVGLTSRDIVYAFEEHSTGIADCYTFSRRPLQLVYYETIPTYDDAYKRARQFQGWSRAKKKALIEQNFHKLQLLAQCQNMSHHKYMDVAISSNVLPGEDKIYASIPNENDVAKKDLSGNSNNLTPFDFAQDNPQSPSTTLSTFPRIGILGGGQLGRMLLQAAANYPVQTFIMENDEQCPAAHLCHHFIKGDIRNFEDVYNFGKGLDAITIEIEAVNVEALEKLESEGVKVFPKPAVIRTINNKILQKQFYEQHKIPSPEFVITNKLHEVPQHQSLLPAVHKIGMGGYDGRGVQVMRSATDMDKGFDAPSVLEKMVDIKMEIAIMIAMNEKSDTATYPSVEMMMDPVLNLLDYHITPAGLSQNIVLKAEAVAMKVVKEFGSPGIFAIEMFVDKNEDVWVNETAPRVHNSGHHTIEANYCSQFDMLWRVMLGHPLGNTAAILPSCMVNIVGAKNFEGNAVYDGMEDVLKMDNAFIHLYGKTKTTPGRKMGHVTIMGSERQELINEANRIKQTLRVIA